MANNYPKLHNAMWPGLVGKKSMGGEEADLLLDEMIDLTANAEVDGVKFDGIDIFLNAPHTPIDAGDDALKALADKVKSKGLTIGSIVAPVWFFGNAMGDAEKRKGWVDCVAKTVKAAKKLRELGVRPTGVVRIDSAAGVTDWDKDPKGNTKLIADTFREAGKIAKDNGERLAAEGEICWGGMHSWKNMVELLEQVGMRDTVGFQADMSHTHLYILGANAEQHRIVPADFHWEPGAFHEAMTKMTNALRPWTIDFHVAQNDGTAYGSGSHEKTGKHCRIGDPKGKLNVTRDAGYWLRDDKNAVTKKFRHICWDGCMFSNAVMKNQQTWNDVLAGMISVRENHGWSE
jgi:sugar phosphate isomerase/epimerase